MCLQRGNGPILKLENIKKDYYQLTFPQPTANELAKVRFERDNFGKVSGFTFVFSDGREEFVEKD